MHLSIVPGGGQGGVLNRDAELRGGTPFDIVSRDDCVPSNRMQTMISDEMHRREFRLARALALHFEERAIFENLVHLPFSASEQVDIAALLKDEGYVHSSADWGRELPLLADTVRDLSANGLSPVSAFVYDEFWCPFLKLPCSPSDHAPCRLERDLVTADALSRPTERG